MFGGPPPDPGFEEAFDRLFPQAFGLAQRTVGEPVAAESIASEALARAYARWSKLAWQPHLDDWVLRATTNLALNHVRRARRAGTGIATPTPPVLEGDEAPVRPGRGRAEVLDGIERRGLALRGRHRMSRRALIAAAALVFTGPLFAALLGGDGDDDTKVAALSRATTTVAPSTTASTVNAVTIPGSSTMVAPPTSATPVAPVLVTPPTFFFEGSGSSFPPTTVPPEPQCGGAQLSATVTTDKASYRPGEKVKASASLRNNSAGPCYYASYTVSNIWRGPEGGEVRPRQALVADAFRYVRVDPGEEFTRNDEWDQCVSVASGEPCTAASPGNYAVTMSWQFSGTPIDATASFELTAAPPP